MSKTDLSKYHNGIIRSGNEGKDNVVQSSQKLVSANQELFDNVVTRNYLQLLDNCEVIPMDEKEREFSKRILSNDSKYYRRV